MKLTENLIKVLATPSNCRLGEELADAGEVEMEQITDTEVSGYVGKKLTQRRRVEISRTPTGGLTWKCTCMSATKKVFCKHCVALGLEVIHSNEL